jgi:hypothetical protein
MSSLAIVAVFLFLLIIVVLIIRETSMWNYYDVGPDEEVTTTTTTTTTTTVDEGSGYAQPARPLGLNVNGIPIVGMLQRQYEGTTPYVIDPVDKDKVFLNTRDDIYEDGAGKVWGLV